MRNIIEKKYDKEIIMKFKAKEQLLNKKQIENSYENNENYPYFPHYQI